MEHLGDITKIHGDTIPPVDVVTGGSPCQDLSIAGLRKGLNGERSGLFLEQTRVVKELRYANKNVARELIRPRYMVWENVTGAFSSNGGRDFQTVLTEIVRIVEPSAPDVPLPKGGWRNAGVLMGDGWSVCWRVFDAQFWGVPQRRRRICLIADFGGQSATEILFNVKGMSGDSQASIATGESTPGSDGRRACPCVYDARGNGDGRTVCTLTGDHANRVTDYTPIIITPEGIARRLTPLECERLQGFPDSWTDIGNWTDSKGRVRVTSDSARYKTLGNAIALPPWKWVLKRISAQYERDATLGSLFDGIGGFPLIWEQINGKGTALWASEIEPFCIAVTKRHFG